MEPISAGYFVESLKRQRAAGKQKKAAVKKKKLGPPSPTCSPPAGAAGRPGGARSPAPPRVVSPRIPRDGGSGKGKGKAVVDPAAAADPPAVADVAEVADSAAEVPPRGESSIPQTVEIQTESARYAFHVPRGHRVLGARAREGDEWIQHLRTRMSDSALHDPVIAREMAKSIMLPNDVEELKARSVGEILDDLFPNSVRALHNLAAMRELVMQYYARADSWEAKARAAEDRASGLESCRREAEERESSLRAELETLRRGRDESEALLRTRETELQQTTADLSRMTALHTQIEQRADAADQRADAADQRSGILEERLASTAKSLRHAEGRAKAAEDTAEERTSSAVARAVRDYRGSEQFKADVADAGSGAFLCGFEECRRRVGEAFPELDLRRIAILEEESEEEGAAEPGAADQPVEAAAPSEDPPAVVAVSTSEEDPSGPGLPEQGA